MIRCKMVLRNVIPYANGGVKAIFECQYDAKVVEEDIGFQKATPWGTIEMQVDNPKAIAQLVIQQSYYVDFSPVPASP